MNYDYNSRDIPEEEQCGNCQYYLPIGWFRHGLNLYDKYSDNNIWFGQQNIVGEWPIAFHGTCLQAIDESTRQDFLSNLIEKDIKPGFYVTTHCNGGADAFTTPFTVTNGDKKERFRIVFQCRVKPNSFTTHTDIFKEGEAWRIVNPQAIRPYGLLLKNE